MRSWLRTIRNIIVLGVAAVGAILGMYFGADALRTESSGSVMQRAPRMPEDETTRLWGAPEPECPLEPITHQPVRFVTPQDPCVDLCRCRER